MAFRETFYLDANTVIGIIERRTPFTPAQEAFLKGIDAGSVAAASSDVALLECLVKPLRDGNRLLTDAALAFFDGGNLRLMPLERRVVLRAAELRALERLTLPDAMHVACALEAGGTVLLSADKRLRVPPGLRRLDFEDLTPG